MQLEGVEARQLSALHGELIAFDWIEQNTGAAVSLPNGTISACYRVTLDGLRALRQVQNGEPEEDRSEVAGESAPRFPRRKKERAETVAV